MQANKFNPIIALIGRVRNMNSKEKSWISGLLMPHNGRFTIYVVCDKSRYIPVREFQLVPSYVRDQMSSTWISFQKILDELWYFWNVSVPNNTSSIKANILFSF
jgi:hypothetical protein